MCLADPLWGAPRIHGELLKLGIDVSEATVSKYMVRRREPPSQTWRTFLENHAKELIALDFFTVPTATFRVLFVLIILSHDRRRILHFNVTAHPTAGWTARQLVEAWEPRHAALVDELGPGCPPTEKVAAGQLLYKWVENEAQFTLRSVRDRFLTHGSYHILSNRYAVGWHPEYQSDQDDPSDDGVG